MHAASPSRSLGTPILATVFVIAAAAAGGIITAQGIDVGWYAQLEKPPLNPPNAVFSPVWTTLYLLMIASFWMVWKRAPEGDYRYQMGFYVNIALNFLWSAAFFGVKSPWAGVAIILGLIACIVWMIRDYRRHSVAAAWMLVPYLLWVSFATYLNVGIAILNS